MNENAIVKMLEEYKGSEADNLVKLFNMQAMFDLYIQQKRGLDYSNTDEWVQKMCTAIITEACELNDACNWKWWKNEKEIDWENVKEEIIDLWHFLMSVTIKVGLSPEDVVKRYIEKNLENYNRQLGTSERKDYKYNTSKL